MFIVHDESGQRFVAKVLQISQAQSWNEMARFEREPQLLSMLKHPQIPRLVDAIKTDDTLVIIQDYVEGEDLSAALSRGILFNEALIKSLAIQAIDILTFLKEHDPPVVHRDIKPSNLIVSPEGNLHLIDFGGALTEGETTDHVIATPGYAAPEAVMGRVTTASDLYSLGMTLVHLATQKHPSDLQSDGLTTKWQDHANLSAPMVDFINQLTQPDPNQRYTSLRDAKASLSSNSQLALRSTDSPITLTQPPTQRLSLQRTNGLEITYAPTDGDDQSMPLFIGFMLLGIATSFFELPEKFVVVPTLMVIIGVLGMIASFFGAFAKSTVRRLKIGPTLVEYTDGQESQVWRKGEFRGLKVDSQTERRTLQLSIELASGISVPVFRDATPIEKQWIADSANLALLEE